MGTRTTLQPVFESVKTDHATVHGSVPHRHSTSKVLLCLFVSVGVMRTWTWGCGTLALTLT